LGQPRSWFLFLNNETETLSFSKIFRLQTRVFGNPCQHARTDFVVVVKGEHEIG